MAERSDNSILVQRYAAAWRQAAGKDAGATLAAEATELQSSLANDGRLAALLSNPALPHHALAAALKQVAEKNGFSKITAQFLFVLASAGRQSLLPKILTELQLQLDTAAGISHATLISATALPAAAVADLKKLLGEQLNSDVRLTTEIEPNLLGGVQIEMNSWLMDASLTGQLSRLERKLKSPQAA
jgi:F-type H+-transporting ATPase subunit delta